MTLTANSLYIPKYVPRKQRTRFTAEEDNIIVDVVKKQGPKNWQKFSEYLPGRTARQIRERWVNYLSPENSKNPWTSQEDAKILSSVQQLGKKWSEIAKLFTDRTDISIKNRFNLLLRREKKKYLKSMNNYVFTGIGSDVPSPTEKPIDEHPKETFPFLTTVQANEFFPHFSGDFSDIQYIVGPSKILDEGITCA